MQQATLLSVCLIDHRLPATLHELYETPTETFDGIEDALVGNPLPFLARHNTTPNDLPTSPLNTNTKLIGAVALMNGFIRSNFTGPFDLPLGDDSVEYLSIDGEKANPLVRNALWLHAAAKTLGVLRDTGVFLLEWFIARQAAVHQRVLENPSSSLCTRLDENYRRALSSILANTESLPEALRARFVEKCFVEHAVGLYASQQFKRFNGVMADIAQTLKIFVELSGALGKRTKFQEKETAQLFVRVDRRPNPASEIRRQACASLLVETQVADDSDMLSNPAYSQDIDYTPLSASDEGVVLLTAMNFYRRHARDDLVLEQLIPFPSRVLRDRLDFAPFLMACLLKSRYEATVTHYLWRAVEQANAVVKYLEASDIPPQDRLESVHLVLLPPIFCLRKEIGMRMLLMGDAATAIDYFTSVNMKTEIVAAYVSLKDFERAERVCRELLESGKRDPELYCLMYEITKEAHYLTTAWEESKRTYVQAQRVLGLHYLNRKEWKAAKEHFDIALETNPLYQRAWYALGVCCVQLGDMEGAKKAFKKGVSLDNDDGQCWTNLASTYCELGAKREAQVALKEAVRCIRENIHLWTNLVIVSIDVQDFRQALGALMEIHRIKRSEVKPKILCMLCDVVLQDIPMANGETGRAMRPTIERFLKQIMQDPDRDLLFQVAHDGAELMGKLDD